MTEPERVLPAVDLEELEAMLARDRRLREALEEIAHEYTVYTLAGRIARAALAESPEECPTCCSVERDERLDVTEKEHAIPLGNPNAVLIPCPDSWHESPEDRDEGDWTQAAIPIESDPSSPRPEQGCTCDDRFRSEHDWRPDPACPVHGRPERCPTCGSDDPTTKLLGCDDRPLGRYHPDPWHSR